MNRSISAYVGNRIKLYRKCKHMTQDELASRIGKSKATLSKYENGSIVIDVETLNDIARVLQTPVTCFVGGFESYMKYSVELSMAADMYAYFLDDHGTKVRESFLEILDGEEGLTATLYCDAPEDDKNKASLIYIGSMLMTETVISFDLVSTKNNLDHIYFTSLRPFVNQGPYITGLCIGLNFAPICPVCFKIVLSCGRCEDKEEMLGLLRVSDAELKSLRRCSRLCI